MDIHQLATSGAFVASPETKTLKIGKSEHTVGIRHLSVGDVEAIQAAGGSVAATIALAVEFDNDQRLTQEQAERLTPQIAAELMRLINEVNEPKN